MNTANCTCSNSADQATEESTIHREIGQCLGDWRGMQLRKVLANETPSATLSSAESYSHQPEGSRSWIPRYGAVPATAIAYKLSRDLAGEDLTLKVSP